MPWNELRQGMSNLAEAMSQVKKVGQQICGGQGLPLRLLALQCLQDVPAETLTRWPAENTRAIPHDLSAPRLRDPPQC